MIITAPNLMISLIAGLKFISSSKDNWLDLDSLIIFSPRFSFYLLISINNETIIPIKNNNNQSKKQNVEDKRKMSELTNHTPSKEKSLNKSNFKLITTNQTPFRHRRGTFTSDPLPRRRRHIADASTGGTFHTFNTLPIRFPISKNHNHSMKSFQSPSKTC